jgi:hypothetical protein
VEEVLVVLQGMHQPIPVGAVVEDAATKALPPPPAEPGNDSKQPKMTQTEADKVVQKYQQIGKDQNHVYGGLASGLPNFNAKPNASAAPGTATPAPKVAPPTPAAASPVLPLGAPRPKPSERAAPPPQ